MWKTHKEEEEEEEDYKNFRIIIALGFKDLALIWSTTINTSFCHKISAYILNNVIISTCFPVTSDRMKV